MKVPARQLEHAAAEAAEYFPFMHAPVTADRPDISQYEPAGQALQLDDPAVGWNNPAEHLMHALDDETEYFPPVQIPVTEERADEAQYDPAGHATHDVDPAEA